MPSPSKLADRIVEQLLGSRRVFSSQELEKKQPAKTPRSVAAQIEDGRKQRADSIRLMRGHERLF